MNKLILLLCVCVVVLLGFWLSGARGAEAAEVTLTWDEVVSPNLEGYKVYSGSQSREYGAPATIGKVTTHVATFIPGQTIYFAVTAFDIEGIESDYSNEVSTHVKLQAPTGLKALLQKLVSWLFGGTLKIAG